MSVAMQARGCFMALDELFQIGICDAPTFTDIDGAQFTGLDPVPHGRLRNLQAISHFLDGLILIMGHRFAPFAVFCCSIAMDRPG